MHLRLPSFAFLVLLWTWMPGCMLRGEGYRPELCVLTSQDPADHEVACGPGNACAVRTSVMEREVELYCRPAGEGREGASCDDDDGLCAAGYKCVERGTGEPRACVRLCVIGEACPSGSCASAFGIDVVQSDETQVGLCI